MTWQTIARNLRSGERRKIPHCGKDNTAYVSNSNKGISLHCFRCKEDAFEPHGRISAAGYLRMHRADEEAKAAGIPPDIRPFGPDDRQASLWLLRAGLRPEHCTDKYGFGWSDKIQRVIIPLLHNGEHTGHWIARAVDGRSPKYLFPKGSNHVGWYTANTRGKAMVVCEDVLSGIKCAEAGYNSYAVCGTSVSMHQAAVISDHDVIGWFDGDKAGDAAFVRLRKALRPFGVEPRKVRTDEDPKLYTRQQIRNTIDGS